LSILPECEKVRRINSERWIYSPNQHPSMEIYGQPQAQWNCHRNHVWQQLDLWLSSTYHACTWRCVFWYSALVESELGDNRSHGRLTRFGVPLGEGVQVCDREWLCCLKFAGMRLGQQLTKSLITSSIEKMSNAGVQGWMEPEIPYRYNI